MTAIVHRAKQWLFIHYWWLTGLSLTGVLAYWGGFAPGADWKLPLTIVGSVISFAFFVQKQKLDELKLFRGLFTDFTSAYEGLNDDLQRMAQDGKIFGVADNEKVIEYFNLCAEEYWWYKAGYIPDSVWGFWCRGMLCFFEKEHFERLWKSEQATRSYYGLTIAEIKRGASLSH